MQSEFTDCIQVQVSGVSDHFTCSLVLSAGFSMEFFLFHMVFLAFYDKNREQKCRSEATELQVK